MTVGKSTVQAPVPKRRGKSRCVVRVAVMHGRAKAGLMLQSDNGMRVGGGKRKSRIRVFKRKRSINYTLLPGIFFGNLARQASFD